MASGRSLIQLNKLNSLAKCSLSTQSSTSKLVKAPIPMFGMDGRYAAALYSAASKKGTLEQVDKNLQTLLNLHAKDTKFHDFLLNPLIKPNQKKEILGKSLQSKLNLDELTLNLLILLAENNRMKLFPMVVRIFNKAMTVNRGEVNVTVTAASPLDNESMKELDNILQNFTKGKKLIINIKIDKSILGGLIVDFDGEHFIDLSIRKKFNYYVDLLKQPL